MTFMKKFLLVVSSAVLLAGCTSMNVFKDNDTAKVPEPGLEDQAAAGQTPPGVIPAAEIKRLLSGKSWKWVSSRNGLSGVTLYADDGSSLIEVSGKGTTTGKWLVKDGQLCESTAPASFLPDGQPMTCRDFSGSNNQYQVGSATFTLA
jgi:Protein of unknown function (DUF995)